jgi:hypothetical protein
MFLCHNIHQSIEGIFNVKNNYTPTGQTLENNGEKFGVFPRLQVTGGVEMEGSYPICLFIS